MKTCKECGELKNKEDFHKHKNMRSGYLNICKTCTNTRDRVRRQGDGLPDKMPVSKKIAITKKRNEIARYGIDVVEVLDYQDNSMSLDDAMHEINGY